MMRQKTTTLAGRQPSLNRSHGYSFSKVGQTSRSRSRGQKLWHNVKGLATRNTHIQYESLASSGKKVMAKVKVFSKEGQTSRSRSQKLWHQVKGLVTRNTHVQYESPILLVRKLWPRLKFFKSRSNFKVKVTRSKIIVPCERPCRMEYTCAILKPYLFW